MTLPTKPGFYKGRLITLGMAQTEILGPVETVEVVDGVLNPRNHMLLVKTGLSHPQYRGLSCYDWASP